MLRVFRYHNLQAEILLIPDEKEFSCKVCCKPIRFRGKSPYRCPGCAEPLPDISALIEDLETRVSYHKFGEVAIVHADILHTQAR